MSRPLSADQLDAIIDLDEIPEYDPEAADNLIHCSAFAIEFTDEEALSTYKAIAHQMFNAQQE
jgi:hypothetical protein